jgi:glycosyltransferase involved in cell wall biosynthesis
MEEYPLISIVSPVKNAAPFIEACVKSVLAQSYTSWELIFVNDGSTDRSMAIIEQYAAKDQRIHVFQNEGRGITPALNTAFEKVRGKYISRMDADDLMPEGRLQGFKETLEVSNKNTVVTGKVRYVSDKPISTGYRTYENWLNQRVANHDHWEHIYRECVVASPNWIMHTARLKAIGGFVGLEYPEDYDLCFRWYKAGLDIVGIDEITLHWREHPTRTSRHSEHYQQHAFFRLKLKRFLELDYKPQRPLVLMGKGKKAKFSAELLVEFTAPFIWIAQEKGEAIVNDQTIKIEALHTLSEFVKPQLLIAVFPDQEKREALEHYLYGLSLELGKDYWYL